DAKRGDIGSTMAGYADAWLSDSSPLRADAVTVSPYLGVAALQPVFELAAQTGRGVFVLAATSNQEAVLLQNFSDGEQTVAQHVVDTCAAFNSEFGAQTSAGKEDRKSTRLNSSHVSISYAVFCLKKKTYEAEL